MLLTGTFRCRIFHVSFINVGEKMSNEVMHLHLMIYELSHAVQNACNMHTKMRRPHERKLKTFARCFFSNLFSVNTSQTK